MKKQNFPVTVTDLPNKEKPFVWLTETGEIVSQHDTNESAMSHFPVRAGEYLLFYYVDHGFIRASTLSIHEGD
jgi:hypothetical protein